MKKHQRQELEESIQRDAARYRWLKERHTGGSEIGVWRETKEGMALKGGWLCGIELDEAVDYAMTLTPNAALTGAEGVRVEGTVRGSE